MNDSSLNSVAINEGPNDVLVRAFVNVRAYAMAAVTGRVLRAREVSASVQAQVAAIPRALWSSQVATQCQAVVDAVARAAGRVVANVTAEAQVTVIRPAVQFLVAAAASATIGITARLLGRAPLSTTGTADLDAIVSKLVTSPVGAEAEALITYQARVLVSGVASIVALADIDTDPNTIKRVQFDEYAVESQTFVVRFENNVFYVR